MSEDEGFIPPDLSDIQAFLDRWIRERGGYWSPLSQFARLAEEVGEFGRELNFRYGDKRRAAKDAEGSLTDELGDVLFIVLLLANDLGINLHRALAETLQKYGQRVQP